MRSLHTAKALRLALAVLLLGMGIGLLIAGGLERLEEDSDDRAGAGEHMEAAKYGEAERSGVVVHAAMVGPGNSKKYVRKVPA